MKAIELISIARNPENNDVVLGVFIICLLVVCATKYLFAKNFKTLKNKTEYLSFTDDNTTVFSFIINILMIILVSVLLVSHFDIKIANYPLGLPLRFLACFFVISFVMLMGFTYKDDALNMVQYGAVMRYKEIRRRLEREVCRFQEFSRFHLVDGHFYVAHIEPKSYLVVALGPIFADRMPSEDWMIVDDVHKEAVVHVKNSKYYLRKLTDEEFQRVLLTEKQNDEYTDLWKVFFDSIAIKERTNECCQNTLFPIWTRKHAVEFNKE